MKMRSINMGLHGEFSDVFIVDEIADRDMWSGWERERLLSMQDHLRPGMTLVDVGTEHAWLTAVYGQFVGTENLVLCEPSPEMWQDIRLTWQANRFEGPLAIWPGFVGAKDSAIHGLTSEWPAWTDETSPEGPWMPYRHLNEHGDILQTLTIDSIDEQLDLFAFRTVDAITVDVEGAEFEVMKGAERVLRHRKPLVWLSVHPDLMARDFDASPQELFEFMDSCGYRRQFLGQDHEMHYAFFPRQVWR